MMQLSNVIKEDTFFLINSVPCEMRLVFWKKLIGDREIKVQVQGTKQHICCEPLLRGTSIIYFTLFISNTFTIYCSTYFLHIILS